MFWLSNSESEGESQGTNNKIKRNIWRIYAIFYISRHMSSGLIQVQKHKQHHCKLQNCPPNYLWYHKNPNIWPHLGLWLKKNLKKKKKSLHLLDSVKLSWSHTELGTISLNLWVVCVFFVKLWLVRCTSLDSTLLKSVTYANLVSCSQTWNPLLSDKHDSCINST